MGITSGFHIVISGYGLWLPGDQRGHWSDAWDEQVGFLDPHMLHPGDPVRLRMAEERLKHVPVRFSPTMINVVVATLQRCCDASDWSIAAASIEATHTHLLITPTWRDIDNTVKWLKDQCTKAIHRETPHDGPVWCKGNWRSFIFESAVWEATRLYIERHNVRRGVGTRPYDFLA